MNSAWKRRPTPHLEIARTTYGPRGVIDAMLEGVRKDLGPTTAEIAGSFYGVTPSPWAPSRRTPSGILDISRAQGPQPTAVLTSLVRASISVDRWLAEGLH